MEISGVRVNGQDIECEYVVLATGMWSRQIGEKIELVFHFIQLNIFM